LAIALSMNVNICVRKGGKEGGEGRDKRIDPGGGKGWREREKTR